jgi:hypothetical protein
VEYGVGRYFRMDSIDSTRAKAEWKFTPEVEREMFQQSLEIRSVSQPIGAGKGKLMG